MADRVIFVCTLVLAGLYFYATEQLPSLEIGDPLGPKAFPRLLGVGLVVTAVILLLEMLRARRTAPPPAAQGGIGDIRPYLIVAAVSVWTFLYFLVFERLGYVLATIPYLLALMAYFNRGKWIANVVTSVLFCLVSYWMFKTLGVNLARGIMPF